MKLQESFSLNAKFILPLAMLYITLNITSDTVAFRFYNLGELAISASGLIYPLSFFITDSIAEVYGYVAARKVIWAGLVCELIFAILAELLIRLPLKSPITNQHAFIITLGPVLRFVFSCIIGDIAGIFLNIYCISKWKIILNGRFFWIRSIFSTSLGELFQTFISVFLAFSGYSNFATNLRIAATTYGLLVAYAVILVWPTWLFTATLKRKERIDVYDIKTNFNPFRL